MSVRRALLWSSPTLLVALLLLGSLVWSGYPAWSYEPREGQLIFQSLPHMDLVDAIEGVTGSPYSHCGIVVQGADGWQVLEAFGPVGTTPLERFIGRGRGRSFAVYEIVEGDAARIAAFIAAARALAGRPYDSRYRLDREAIYCSELIWHAWQDAAGEELATLSRLGDLAWEPWTDTIRKYEGGEPPLDRLMITPVALTRSAKLRLVHPLP